MRISNGNININVSQMGRITAQTVARGATGVDEVGGYNTVGYGKRPAL